MGRELGIERVIDLQDANAHLFVVNMACGQQHSTIVLLCGVAIDE
jgi:hypothetical protein